LCANGKAIFPARSGNLLTEEKSVGHQPWLSLMSSGMSRANPIAVLLITVIFLFSLASCWFAGWWFLGARELQALEYQYQSMQQTSSAIQALANESIEYSRRNPSIDPLLQQFELKSRPTSQAPTNLPVQKPPR